MKHLILLLSFFFLSFSPMSDRLEVYSTNCHQTFHFFFLSKGSPTFWIGEDLSGECRFSRLLQIGVKDSDLSLSESELKDYKKWGDIPDLESLFRIYNEQPLELNGDVWENEKLKIEPPAYDSLLAEEFKEHIYQGGSDAQTWLKQKGSSGIELPEIEGINAELLYSYEAGLYFNYEIEEVHYFPGAYILVFTHQPGLAVGLNTMHGFFIFRIINS